MSIQSCALVLATLALLSQGRLAAQANLVPNGSFESYSICPDGNAGIEKVLFWYSPRNEYNDESLDGFACNRCAPPGTSGNVPFPAGGFSYQEPVSGDGYGGVVLNQAVANALLRNYIATPLLDTLEAGRLYFVSWFVNNEDHQIYGSNNMSMWLTDTPVTRSYGGGGYILANAQIMAYGNPIIADTQHWVQIAAVYQAQGTETAIMIGDFTDGTNQDTIRIHDDPYGIASYYVDDVSITPLDSLPRLFIAGPDTSVYLGSSVKIGTLINGLPGMQWFDESGALISTGPPQVSVSPTVNTWYRAEVTVGGITYRDTVNVAVIDTGSTGVQDAALAAGIQVYPNPTQGNFEITLPADYADWRVTITDTRGATVQELAKPAARTINVNIQATPGLYFILFRDAKTGRHFTKKLTVQS